MLAGEFQQVSKSQFYTSKFLMVDPHFVRRGCAGPHQICILPHVWMSDLRDVEDPWASTIDSNQYSRSIDFAIDLGIGSDTAKFDQI